MNGRIFYHGSPVKGIKTLQPFSKSHNTIKKPVVYLTPNETLALFYIWNRAYKYVTFSENESGVVVYTESYENQFKDLYKGVSGSVYECKDDPCIYLTHVAGVYNSEQPVDVCKETVIDDVYEEICKRMGRGKVILKTYASLTPEEKEKDEKSLIRAIHFLRLLKPGGTETDAALRAFYKEHFPAAWRRAEKMTEEDIKAMREEWERSVGV